MEQDPVEVQGVDVMELVEITVPEMKE